MKVVCISDTHSMHEDLIIPDGDLLIHGGDFCRYGDLDEVIHFVNFIKNQPHKFKVIIAGNHDFPLENKYKAEAENLILNSGCIYLNDSGVTLEGFNIWGSPVQPEFGGWAFNRKRGSEIKRHWDLIPEDTDILITHGPPLGILDSIYDSRTVGCKELLDRVQSISPRLHVFGHIHESYGLEKVGQTLFVNASSVDFAYSGLREPIVVSL